MPPPIDRGEVWLTDLGMTAKVRPCLVLSVRPGPADRVLFGSHAPLFYFESSLLKLKESPLSQEQLRAIRFGSARKLASL